MKNSLLIVVIIGLFQLVGFASNAQSSTNVISANDFAKSISADKSAQIVDVRTPGEYSSGHIKNAKNINWNDANFMANMSKIDKSKPVYIYCQAGGRSAAANKKLTKEGYKVIELEGGMNSWLGTGNKVEK